MSDSAQVSVTEAIRAVLAQAIKDGGCVNAAVSASVIAESFPGSGETPAQIAERIAVAATYAQVAVEIGKPMPRW